MAHKDGGDYKYGDLNTGSLFILCQILLNEFLSFLFAYSEEIVELQIQIDTGQGLETTLRQSLQEVKG